MLWVLFPTALYASVRLRLDGHREGAADARRASAMWQV